MEKAKRTIAKAVCWQASGLTVMTLLGYAFTGSLSEGGALAIMSTIIGLLCYIVHERIWAHISWGRMLDGR